MMSEWTRFLQPEEGESGEVISGSIVAFLGVLIDAYDFQRRTEPAKTAAEIGAQFRATFVHDENDPRTVRGMNGTDDRAVYLAALSA
jgi:hypothetical protein